MTLIQEKDTQPRERYRTGDSPAQRRLSKFRAKYPMAHPNHWHGISSSYRRDDDHEDTLWDRYDLDPSIGNRNAIVDYHLPYVRAQAEMLVQRLVRSVVTHDLFSAGVFGLIESVPRFDRSTGIRFRTFSSLRIRGAMLDYLRGVDHVTRYTRAKVKRYKDDIEAVELKLGRKASSVEVAEVLGVSHEEIMRRENVMNTHKVMSLNTDFTPDNEVDDDDEPGFVLEQCSYTENPSERIDDEEFKNSIKALFGNSRDWDIVHLYYWGDMTMLDVGKKLGVSESRVCQLLRRARSKLHEYLSAYHEFLKK